MLSSIELHLDSDGFRFLQEDVPRRSACLAFGKNLRELFLGLSPETCHKHDLGSFNHRSHKRSVLLRKTDDLKPPLGRIMDARFKG